MTIIPRNAISGIHICFVLHDTDDNERPHIVNPIVHNIDNENNT